MSDAQIGRTPVSQDMALPARREPIELTVDVFAQLVGNASRFLTGVAALAPFKEGKLGLAEWIALSLIAQNDGLTSRQIATRLGVTAQRVNQLTASLSAAQLIAVDQSSVDSRKKPIRITQAGRNELESLNAKLSPLLVEPLKANAASVVRMARQINRLTKVVAPTKAQGEKAGGRRAARRAAWAAKRAEA